MTYQRIKDFEKFAEAWLSFKQPESKLTYAVRKVLKRVKPLLESYDEQVQDITIAHAVEKDGVLQLTPQGGMMMFSRADLIAKIAKERALAKSEVEIEPFWVTTIPKELSVATVEAFTGFVFQPQPDVEPTDDPVDADGTD